MVWKKYIVENRYFYFTYILAIFLLIGGFVFQSWMVFFAATVILVFYYVNNYYLNHIGERLQLLNNKNRERIFIGDKGSWVLEFENHGFPIMKGEMRIGFDDVVSPYLESSINRAGQHEISIPFSIHHSQRQSVAIPFSSVRRGVARIRRMEIKVPHFFGFGETTLSYDPFIKPEVLVYPKPTVVKNLNTLHSNRPGESHERFSLYDDLLAPAGTRQYFQSDPFNHVHWKASARSHTLQTKVFERIVERGWHLSLNIADGYSVNGQLELLVSSAAEIAYYSNKHEIAFSLSVNMRIAGSIPFLYIPVGSDTAHLQKVLESLAIISRYSMLYPYDDMISFYHSHLAVQPYFVHGGILTAKTTRGYFL